MPLNPRETIERKLFDKLGGLVDGRCYPIHKEAPIAPYLTYQLITLTRDEDVVLNTGRVAQAFYQLNIFTKTYAESKSLGFLCTNALRGFHPPTIDRIENIDEISNIDLLPEVQGLRDPTIDELPNIDSWLSVDELPPLIATLLRDERESYEEDTRLYHRMIDFIVHYYES